MQRPENVPADEQWYWTPEWQEGEREVEAQIAAGGCTVYDNADDFIAALKKLMETP